jgi:glycosyltransferase involved in cell wall biosynthesis
MLGFIVPDLDGPVSGGTLFNRGLVAALQAAGVSCDVLPLTTAPAALARGSASDTFWVDSLFLDHVPRLERARRAPSRLGLLAHYLPSLVNHGENLSRGDLTPAEACALVSVDLVLAPSRFMRNTVARLSHSPRTILELEPGRLATGPAALRAPPVRGVLVANLLPGKGVLPFLQGLARCASASDAFSLELIGGVGPDASYAADCRRAADTPALRGRIRLRGALTPEETVARMASGNLCVSASLMESYGMALAEARTLGLPILARHGGNVRALVEAPAGGELVPDAATLAGAFLGLCRNPAEHGRRIRRAGSSAWPARPWATVAREFLRQIERLSTAGRTLWSEGHVHRA